MGAVVKWYVDRIAIGCANTLERVFGIKTKEVVEWRNLLCTTTPSGHYVPVGWRRTLQSVGHSATFRRKLAHVALDDAFVVHFTANKEIRVKILYTHTHSEKRYDFKPTV